MKEYEDTHSSRLDFRDLGIPVGPEHVCPYLEGRTARERAFFLEQAPGGLYKHLMDHGWRRSGMIIYKPACESCGQCVPIRVPVADFKPSRVQRRIGRRNEDITAQWDTPGATDEKFRLFVKYQEGRHDGSMCTRREDFEKFLYESPVRTREVEFRLEGRLSAVAIVDEDGPSLSAVYTWYDPDLGERSLGTWAILWFIEQARERGIPWYYMGYYIRGCEKMNYKKWFRPCEVGDGAGGWSRLVEHDEGENRV